MFKAVIFDLDDTLIDFRERKKVLIHDSVKAMIKAGLKEDFETLHAEFVDFYWKTGIEDQNIFEKFLLHKYGTVDYRILAHAVVAYRKANSMLLETYPDVMKVLKKLKMKGLKIGVLSDAPKIGAYIRLVETGIDEIFDEIVTFDDVHETKPSPKGFSMIASRLGVPVSECLMVGDNPTRDIVGARNVGMKICFARYGRSEEADADYTIDSISELLDIVK